MNDTELDRLLDTWEAPAPPPSLRDGVQARFPVVERRGFIRPRRWLLLAAAAATLTLVIGLAQSGGPADFWPIRILNEFFDALVSAIEVRQASGMMNQIRHANPTVYVDGQFVALPPRRGSAFKFDVDVPGEGIYAFILYAPPGLKDWVKAGHLHGNVIEFQAGSKQVRVVCNQSIVNGDQPVFVMRQ
jgi:hypothetical protein